MAERFYLRRPLGGENCAAAGGYAIRTSAKLDRVLGQVAGNIDADRDMAAEAVAEYIRHRLPDLAVLYPRHRFGFIHRDIGCCVTVEPQVHRCAHLADAFRYVPFVSRMQRLGLDFALARYLMAHLTSVANNLQTIYFRILPEIEASGIDAADKDRSGRLVYRGRAALAGRAVPGVQRPKISGGEHIRQEMLRDCGWL